MPYLCCSFFKLKLNVAVYIPCTSLSPHHLKQGIRDKPNLRVSVQISQA